jgi:hypothetical protein
MKNGSEEDEKTIASFITSMSQNQWHSRRIILLVEYSHLLKKTMMVYGNSSTGQVR